MGMSVGDSGGEDEVMVEMNTTPLIDVMLVLLIMLIVTIPIQTHAVKLDMPVNKPQAPTTPPEVVELQVDFDGTVLWNGNVVPSMGQLNAYLNTVASQPTQPEIHIRPHKLVKYEYVAKVMAATQRLGLKKMGLINDSSIGG